ncbi:MAG: hypothetical protein PHC62_08825 [Candidatus Izemoplasmatales bacterium]|nr:hypothetical protein [Candidatus Izemoplasmatales bacterium]
MKEILGKAKELYKNEPNLFLLAAFKEFVMLLFFISIMIPFYTASGYGIVAHFTVFSLNGWFWSFLILLVWLGSMGSFFYFTLVKKPDILKKIQLGQVVLSALLFVIFFIIFVSDAASAPSFIRVYLSLGFFTDLICIAALVLITVRDQLVADFIKQYVKVKKHEETVEPEVQV